MYLPAPRHLADGAGDLARKVGARALFFFVHSQNDQSHRYQQTAPFRSKYKERTARPTTFSHAGFRDAAEWHPPKTIQSHEKGGPPWTPLPMNTSHRPRISGSQIRSSICAVTVLHCAICSTHSMRLPASTRFAICIASSGTSTRKPK